MISNQMLRAVAKIGGALVLAASVTALCLGRILWAAGTLTGGAWAFLNFYFLFRLLEIGFTAAVKAPQDKTGIRSLGGRDQILLLSVLKFPVVYLAGFFILKSRVFPVSGVLTGLTLFFLAVMLSWRRSLA